MKSTFKPNTVVVIDAGVENYQQLMDGVDPSAKTFLLDKTSDGIEQIDRVLELHRETNALHIISHGSPGCLYLGNGQLSLDTLGRYAPQLQRWKLGNLLLYGCNVAAGDAGEELIAKLHRLTGAEIAASTSLTGAAAKGGNWQLEVTTGKAVTALAFEDATLESYPAILTFTDSGQSLGSFSSNDLSLADVDGDGDVDAFVANHTGNQPNKVWLNDGSGNFTDSGQSLGSFYSDAVSLGDVDGDGDVDAFVANKSQNKVWLNDGSGNFTDSGQSLGSFYSFSVSLADVDGDGDVDAFVANWTQPNKVWLNDGSGNFADSGQSLGSSHSIGVSLADVDGDGDVDAFVANFSGQSNKVWLNDGSGNFTDSGQEFGSFQSLAVSLADVDGDGDVDAFVANHYYGNRVFLNESTNNSAPTALNIDNNSMDENVAANTVVGTFSTTDPDAGDTFTYQLVSGTGDTDNAAFTIVGDQLQINSSPDYETQSSYSIRVQTTDAGGLSYSEDFTININDVNEDSTDPTTITGTSQNNILRGTASGETIQGLAGRDRLYGNGGNDTVEGGDGNDILYGNDGDDLLDGGLGNDRLYGDGGKDTLLGGDGNDILYGNDGDDLLDGGAGRDRLYGNAGSDTLDGGAGSDRLYGHAGSSDTFVLAAGMGRDTIFNFEDGTDKIDLGGGLSFAELDIVGSGSSTLVKIEDTGETLATLSRINYTLIGADDFV